MDKKSMRREHYITSLFVVSPSSVRLSVCLSVCDVSAP